jgi:hypothetical protein
MLTEEKVANIVVIIEKGLGKAFHEHHVKPDDHEKTSIYAAFTISEAIDMQTTAIRDLGKIIKEKTIPVPDTKCIAAAIEKIPGANTKLIADAIENMPEVNTKLIAKAIEGIPQTDIHDLVNVDCGK